jgi:hypothetical protein
MKFLETSAKTSQNVGEAFVTMTKEIIDKQATSKPVTTGILKLLIS